MNTKGPVPIGLFPKGALLIGPPGSGKTTMAVLMAPLLNAELLSTDCIRKELYGDETCQGEWSEIEIDCIVNSKNL